jgi:hypothetical protein
MLFTSEDARPVADAISQVLSDLGFATTAPTMTNMSVRQRLELERQAGTADLVIVLWSFGSIADPAILDLADIAARRHRLLSIEAAARTPIGYDGRQAIKVKMGRYKLSRGEFRLRETIARMTEAANLRRPKSIRRSKLAPFLIDFGSMWCLFLMEAMESRELLPSLIGVTVASCAAYLGGIAFDRGVLACGLSIRRYFLRVLIRIIGQIFLLATVVVLLLNGKSSMAQLSMLIFGSSILISLKWLPFVISKKLRRWLLA